jgi:hypothetical protein
LEDTSAASVRVLSLNDVKARDLYVRDASGPCGTLKTTGELRALSMRIKAQGESAELNNKSKAAHSKPDK